MEERYVYIMRYDLDSIKAFDSEEKLIKAIKDSFKGNKYVEFCRVEEDEYYSVIVKMKNEEEEFEDDYIYGEKIRVE